MNQIYYDAVTKMEQMGVDDEYIPLDTLDTLDDFETVPAPGYTARGSTN